MKCTHNLGEGFSVTTHIRGLSIFRPDNCKLELYVASTQAYYHAARVIPYNIPIESINSSNWWGYPMLKTVLDHGKEVLIEGSSFIILSTVEGVEYIIEIRLDDRSGTYNHFMSGGEIKGKAGGITFAKVQNLIVDPNGLTGIGKMNILVAFKG